MRLHEYVPRPAHLRWLLDSDPAIRWQVMRDLANAAPDAIAAERARVTIKGWGAQLLARQSPAGNFGTPNEDRGLLVTLNSLVVLKDLVLDPASKQAGKMARKRPKIAASTAPLPSLPKWHWRAKPVDALAASLA